MSRNVGDAKHNYRLIALEVGEVAKWDTSVNEINRIGQATLCIDPQVFENPAITSVRQQCIYDWVLSLAGTRMEPEERSRRLVAFCEAILGEPRRHDLNAILRRGGVEARTRNRERVRRFQERALHADVVRAAEALFVDGYFFHAVFESAKVYNKRVREKSGLPYDGAKLCQQAWNPLGTLKVTPCETETDRNIQEGLAALSVGLMRAIRNPTAHEPAFDWPIAEPDCLDILSFVSFLHRRLDYAVCVPSEMRS